MSYRVEVVLYDGFDELDAIGPYEVFDNAARGADLTVRMVSLDGSDEITGSHGLEIVPQGVLSREDPPGILIVPGGGWNDRAPEGAWGEARRGDLPRRLAALHRSGTTLGAVCTGGMLLAEAGLLEGRPAVTHAGALEDLEASGARVQTARVVDDGSLLTAGGVTAGLDLALYLVEREWGARLADAVAAGMEYERTGDVYAV